jgi:hypothetical protein
MSDSIIPVLSVDLLVRLTHLIDFKDKILKIFGSSAKVQAILGSPNEKDLRGFASQLSASRRWMKFAKIFRSTTNILNPVGDVALTKSSGFEEYFKVFVSKSEFVADIVQMLAEDVGTLHKSKYWSGGLGLKPVRNIDLIEDRAWWVWSVFATISAWIETRDLHHKLRGSTLRMEALNPETVPLEIASMKQEVAVLRVKYFLSLFKLIKFLCELIDSSIALSPDRVKAISPRGFELVSCFVGSLSAVSSLHNLLYSESRALEASRRSA